MTTRILLAEDHGIVREGLRKLLEERDHLTVVGEASNGEEAVEMAARLRPDLVVMDLGLPKLSGIEATRKICGVGEPPRVLVLSMHREQDYVQEVLRAGAAGYVLKDSAASELVAAIEAVRAGDSYLSPAITQHVVDAVARPREATAEALATLTDREREVLELIAEGLSSKEIASRLGVSLKTIESHRSNLMDKLGIHKVSGLVRFAIRAGMIAP